MHPGLALVGEIDVAVRGEDQIIDALEALRPAPLQHQRHLAAARIERHEPMAVVGDEDPAVARDLQAVGLAVIFGDQREFAGGEMRKIRP